MTGVESVRVGGRLERHRSLQGRSGRDPGGDEQRRGDGRGVEEEGAHPPITPRRTEKWPLVAGSRSTGRSCTYTPFGLAATTRSSSRRSSPTSTRARRAPARPLRLGRDDLRGRTGVLRQLGRRRLLQHPRRQAQQLPAAARRARRPAAGDFDIVFNYGSITWETGDASGGSRRLRRRVRHVGYSNGDGADRHLVRARRLRRQRRVPGRQRRVRPDRPHLSSPQPGPLRLRRPQRRSAAGRVRRDGRLVPVGRRRGRLRARHGHRQGITSACARSTRTRTQLANGGTIPYRLDFVACSGARMPAPDDSARSTNGPPWNEDAQISTTSTSRHGARDDRDRRQRPRLRARDPGLHPEALTSAAPARTPTTSGARRTLLALYERTARRPQRAPADLDDVRFAAFRGRWLVLGYPRFFRLDGGVGLWSSGPFGKRCQTLRHSRPAVDQLQDPPAQLGGPGVRAVDGRRMGRPHDVPEGHELCSGADGSRSERGAPTRQVEVVRPERVRARPVTARRPPLRPGAAGRPRRVRHPPRRA